MEISMKRLLYTLAASAVALSLQAAFPTAGIVGTMHDLSSTGPNKVTNVTEVCVFCHTPHNAATGSAQIIPLWNHTTSSATYTMYETGSTLKGVSAACLSCHDGTVAVGSLINVPYATAKAGGVTYTTATGQVSTSTGMISGTHSLGTDLTNDHPIGVVYDADMQPITKLQAAALPLFNSTGDHSWTVGTDTVECASCHDVHNWGGQTNNVSYTSGTTTTSTTVTTGAPFLRVDNTGSALCLTCHIK